jgi:Ca2+-binding EF-hand superfamily protein
MRKHVLFVTSAFILASGATATAQQNTGPMMQEPEQQAQSTDEDGCGMIGHRWMGHGMMGQGMMAHGMMGRGMIGRGMMGQRVMRVIFALMDSDGDGTISLQEWQAAQEKIFKAMDPDKDGTVSLEEMQNFMHGTRRSEPQR